MDKIKSSLCFSCCFRASDDVADSFAASDQRSGNGSSHNPSSLIQSSSTWIRSKASEIPELKGRCRGIISKIGKGGGGGRRNQPSADFRYDPLSYALNFDEGPDYDDDGEISPVEYKYRSFCSRLPASPPQQPPPVTAACN